MLSTLSRTLILSQLLLFGGVLVCILISPQGLSANDGISFYGTQMKTLIPYIAALAGSSLVGLIAARRFIRSPSFHYVKIGFFVILPLSIGIILTPYTLGRFFSDLHELLGAVVFLIQGFITIRIFVSLRRDLFNLSLLILQLIGGVIAAFYLFPDQGFLLQGQVLFQLAFGAIMIRNANDLSIVKLIQTHEDYGLDYRKHDKNNL